MWITEKYNVTKLPWSEKYKNEVTTTKWLLGGRGNWTALLFFGLECGGSLFYGFVKISHLINLANRFKKGMGKLENAMCTYRPPKEFWVSAWQKKKNSKNKKLVSTFSLYSLASKTHLKCSPMPLTSHIFICVVFYFIAIKNILSFVYASTAHSNERKPPLKALWPTAIWLIY